MYQNTFETLAIEMILSSRQEIANEKWQEIGCFFIKSYLKQLSKAETYLIGHIKGLIELDEGFIKFSSIDSKKTVNYENYFADGNSLEGKLTFNAIVSGVDKKENLQFFHLALARTCSVYELLTDYREEVHEDKQPIHQHEGDEPCPVCQGHHHDSDESCPHH